MKMQIYCGDPADGHFRKGKLPCKNGTARPLISMVMTHDLIIMILIKFIQGGLTLAGFLGALKSVWLISNLVYQY